MLKKKSAFPLTLPARVPLAVRVGPARFSGSVAARLGRLRNLWGSRDASVYLPHATMPVRLSLSRVPPSTNCLLKRRPVHTSHTKSPPKVHVGRMRRAKPEGLVSYVVVKKRDFWAEGVFLLSFKSSLDDSRSGNLLDDITTNE